MKDGQIKLLRKLVLNPVCSHPECSRETEDAHHCFARSAITNDSWWVEITEDSGEKKIIPHVTGLCRKHHRDVEEHRAWIKYEGGTFNWRDRVASDEFFHKVPEDLTNATLWINKGSLVPQPGEVQHPKKKRAAKAAERHDTKQVALTAPTEEMEVFLTLLEEARVMLGREKTNRSRWKFYVLLEVIAVFCRDAQKET